MTPPPCFFPKGTDNYSRCWGSGDVLSRLFISAVVARSQPCTSTVLPLGKDRSEYGEGLYLKSLRSVRLQTLTYRRTYRDGLPPQYLFTWMIRNLILPHWSCTSSYDSTVLMFADRHLWYCDCPAIAVSIML